MKKAVFLQVRLDSTRLPQKALLPLGERTITECCLLALKKVEADEFVLVTEEGSVSALRPLADRCGWQIFSGSKEHVLDRFVQALRYYGVQTVVRATGDNPLVSACSANELLALHEGGNFDYSGFEGAPLGSGVEILEAEALEIAWSSQPDAYEREHVSPFLYRRPERFRILKSPVPEKWRFPDGRVTIDTEADWRYVTELWKDLYVGKPIELEDVIAWIRKHPR